MKSVAANYQLELYAQSGTRVGILDAIQDLEFQKTVNGVGYCNFSLSANNLDLSKFELDGSLNVRRRMVGLGIDWYTESWFLLRDIGFSKASNGKFLFTPKFLHPNDFLARTSIAYPPATIKSYKDMNAEKAMKEFVEENCGPSATMEIGNEREAYGVLPGFTVDTIYGYGSNWEGDKSGENLLDVLQEIAEKSGIDFEVENTSAIAWIFKTYLGQIGRDLTTEGLDPATGKNAAGNIPVTISSSKGNVQDFTYTCERSNEINRILVLGDGDGATRKIVVRETSAITDSPWNRREASRAQGGFQSEMEMAGDEQLAQSATKETYTFTPLQQPSCAYGVHYTVGDKVTVNDCGKILHRRIMSAKISWANPKEQIQLEIK